MELKLSQPHLFWTLAKLTAKRLLNRKSTWLLLAVGLLPCGVALFWILARIFDGRFDLNTSPYGIYEYQISVYFTSFYVPLLSIFLGLGVISDEVESRNLTFTLARPVSRFSIAAGRCLGHLMAAIGLTAVSVICIYLANMLFQVESIIEFFPNLLNGVFALSFSLAAYLSVVAALGTFLKRGAILISIIWMILDTGFSLIPVDFFHFISIKYRMLSSFWDPLPQFMFTFAEIGQSPASINAFWLVALFVALPFAAIAWRLAAGDIVLSEGK